MNYRNGSDLAYRQDSLIQVYQEQKIIDKSIISDMKHNWFIEKTYKINPTNLHVRQYFLIDVFSGNISKKRYERILYLIDELSYQKNAKFGRIWAEGYSYWCYVKRAMELYINRFETDIRVSNLKMIRDEIENGFIKTGYFNYKHNQWFPAPFGDLRETPLENQQYIDLKPVRVGMVTRLKEVVDYHNIFVYIIDGESVGFNNHTPCKRDTIQIINGEPLNFQYYEGYDKKYENKKAEWKDILNPRRFLLFLSW